MTKRPPSSLAENVKTIIYAVVIAIGIRTLAFEPFNIPSGSMIPTLLIGDYVFVSKFSYGYSCYSMPYGPNFFKGRIFGSLPKRGDVAVFRLPKDPSVDYIKRIIGLPGDRIQLKAGQLYINDVLVKRKPIGPYLESDGGVQTEAMRYEEFLPNGVNHDILKMYDTGGVNDTQEYKVPEGHVFAMGDNRDNSVDSRVPGVVGFVPVGNVIARAETRFWAADWRRRCSWPRRIGKTSLPSSETRPSTPRRLPSRSSCARFSPW